MKTIQTAAGQIKIEDILKALALMKIPEFDDFKAQVEKLAKQKKPPAISKKEKELIDKIKNGGPTEKFWKKFDILSAKLEQEIMTDKENQAFMRLVQVSEKWTYERLQLMVELSKLWDVTLDEVLKRLKIKPRKRVYA